MRNTYTGHSVITQFQITIDGSLLGTNQLDLDSPIFFPNPVIDDLHFNFHNTTISKIEVYSLNGQFLETSIINSTNGSVDFSNFESGVYILKFDTERGSFFRKVVK